MQHEGQGNTSTSNQLVRVGDLKQGGRYEDLAKALSPAEGRQLASLARAGKLTEDSIGEATALAAREHQNVSPGQLLVIAGKHGIGLPVASRLADVATEGRETLDQGRVTGIFKEVCRATGCSDSEMADLQEYFKRIPLDRQVKLVEVVGDLSDIAAEHEIQLRAVVRLYAHYNEVGSTRHAVERASEIAGSSNNEVYCGAVVNTMLRAFRNAAQNGSSVQEVERFIDEGDLRSLREVSRREAIA